MNWKNLAVPFLAAGLTLLAGCSPEEDPVNPEVHSIPSLAADWITDLGPAQGVHEGRWEWTWNSPDSLSGQVFLEISAISPPNQGWKVVWDFQDKGTAPNLNYPIYLEPRDLSVWHAFHWTCPFAKPQGPIPMALPVPVPMRCLPVQSPDYGCLLELLQDLTTPYFDQIVTHWPSFPVPVRIGAASNGPVDLAECLTEALTIWNDDEAIPWFKAEQDASWGVQLIHFPERNLNPSMAAKITRLDSIGRPMRVQILTGNNFHDPGDRPYAVRGFVHELGHALFLWGHSQDMFHCLWRRGPPLVSVPSQDERKAARWWHGLPEGLDLSNYQVCQITRCVNAP